MTDVMHRSMYNTVALDTIFGYQLNVFVVTQQHCLLAEGQTDQVREGLFDSCHACRVAMPHLICLFIEVVWWFRDIAEV